MTKAGEAGPTTDPFEVWREMYDANERAWSTALEQAMGTQEFGESSGKLLETMLAAQKSVRTSMRTFLETMNVPTREDIARLGELVVGVEEKIDQVVDRLDAIEEAVSDNLRTSLETMKTINVPTREEIARLGVLVVGLEKKIDRRHALDDAVRAKAAASAKAAAARAVTKAKADAAKAKAANAAASAKVKAAKVKAAKAKATTEAAAAKTVAAKSVSTKGVSASATR
jgi:hypothetical protein